jgi:hypothetical protein
VGGGGYDKSSAAIASAIFKIAKAEPKNERDGGYAEAFNEKRDRFRLAAAAMDAGGWERELERYGFRVLQAV